MRSKFQLAVLFVISAFFFSACSTPAAEPEAIDMDKVKAEIQALEDAYAAAEKAKDADGVAAYYSADAISYGRNEEPASGQAAIKANIAKDLASDTSGNTNVYKVVDIFADGNLLVEIGSWTELSPTGTELNKGHYMSCFQKKDGKYLCVRDMNVASAPVVPKK